MVHGIGCITLAVLLTSAARWGLNMLGFAELVC
jgi:hypothetical protein